MSLRTGVSPSRTALVAAVVLGFALGGCRKPDTDDATVASQVQARLASDPNLSGQSVQAAVAGGVVTLSGSVTSDSARNTASGDAAQVAGVRTVVNNLTLGAAAASPASATVRTPAPLPIAPERGPKPSAAIGRNTPPRLDRQPNWGNQQPQGQTAPIERSAPPVRAQVSEAPAPPPPAPQPVSRDISLPSGTTIPVRITETLDSASTQQGDRFTGAVASDIVIDGVVVLAQGTPVTGHVDAVQDASHFKGSSLLTISLSSISRKGERLDIASEPFTKQGEGRGKNTAEKVGGGAALGAILGGILGGGKGAAIGSAAGAGVGAGAQGMTRGQQVQIPSESLIRFKLTNAVLIRVSTGPGTSGYNQGLERRNP